eukprot:CAMPEP_0113660700 /NCGR_PEP_ID=MMETSP0017_2-20120614/33041_1 /TAXON_ID=2856 /ORGANISM="Cylindrotheca closterium" /LENGTH=890 /DNA_ID=CAMNT_0000575355 /DNA_START=492 /DNA_END=3164 /DNA_ORIENTATION=- /assembly_acc=CAM_ASM_000147
MKTVRVNHHVVLAVFADPDSLDFPDKEFIDKAKEIGKANLEEEKSNKNGVTISELPARIMGAIGERETIELEATTEAPILLRSVDMSGPNGKLFQVANDMPMTVGPSLTLVKLTVKPSKLGVIRAKVTCKFENDDASTFVIARVITMSCGDKAMNEVLKPTSKYERKKRSYLRYDKKDTVGPPKEVKLITGLVGGSGNEGPNPFAKLPQYPVPAEIMESIRADQYSQDMDGIGWSIAPSHDSIQNYGEYWKHLLYASEFQMQRDIRFYDMEDAPLSKEGRYYVLKVPGLAEGRPSVLRGDLVHIDFRGMLFKGRVMYVRQLEVVMDLHSRFGNNFNTGLDRVTVHFTFSRMTLRTSHKVLNNTLAEKELGAAILVPTREQVAQFQSSEDRQQVRLVPRANRSLNPEQEAAVQRIVNGQLRPMPYIIFGPPGTGKTTTVVEAIYQLGKKGKKILLVAPSNDAADILVQRLSSYFPPSELRRILAYSRSITALPAGIQSYATDSLESDGQAREIMGAKIVVSTVNLAARFSYWGIPRGHFDVMCVDEAGHATEPEVVSAAAGLMDFQGTTGSKEVGQLILAGDPKQLGPISNSDICRKYGLTMSLMERLTEREVYGLQVDGKYPEALLTKLVRNYRSHPSILKLPNEMFYQDLQCCGNPMVTMNMARWEHLPKSGFPVVFHAIDGENLREGNSPSWFNPTEAQQVVEYVRLLSRETKPPIKADEIGIITPYARQAQKIRLALGTQHMDDVKVGSVESFQGQERRVIILSTVRAEREEVSNDLRYNLGFVANPKRFNVAVTRAKALLIVVGCPSVLALDEENWLPFMKYCHENGSWVGEDWDPSMVSEDGMQDAASIGSGSSTGSTSSDEEEDMEGPSRTAEEEGFVVVNSEE